ncbi:MAG: cupin domain-containing protein [Actinomycetota bacterium]|nr:cupin domain-containing protein [Actinomycetota bacterium]
MAYSFHEMVSSAEIVGLGGPAVRPLISCKVTSPTEYVSVDDISLALSKNILQAPYLQMMKESVRVPDRDLTSLVRTSRGETYNYIDAEKVSKALAAGYTIKLNQVHHWHQRTDEQVETLASKFPVEVKPFVFLTPAEERGVLPHRDAFHVLVIQLEGRKEWTLWNPGQESRSSYGLDVDLENPLRELVLDPGDVMYLPQGYPHSARAVGGPSLHMTFAMGLPTPDTLIDALLDGAAKRSADPLPSGCGRAELLGWAARDLLRTAAELDSETWFATALARQRARTTARPPRESMPR